MITCLKFVQGSVAKKDFVPALTHFRIENGTVRGFNGNIALCSPIPFDVECSPKGEPMIRAIANCEDTVSLTLTPGGRLAIKSGPFKAFIDCIAGEVPHAKPEGEAVDINGESLLAALKVVAPFIGDDASRPWSNGVLLLGQSAFATNNVILVEYWTGSTIPKPINIPRAAVREMLRINEPPIAVQMSETSISFHYTGDRWLRSQLFALEWPDLYKVLERESKPLPIDERLFNGLEIIKPFADKLGRVYIRDGSIVTHEDEGEGASYQIEGMPSGGIYQIEMLRLLQGSASSVDWTGYPGPCMFFGDRLRGALIGMRA